MKTNGIAVLALLFATTTILHSQSYTFTTLAGCSGYGSADGSGSNASFFYPCSVATDSAGNIYVADQSNFTIRKVTPTGMVSTVAGLARSWGSADGTGSAARFLWPQGVTVDSTGNIFVADTGNHIIRKITSEGVVTTLAGLAGNTGSNDATGSAARFSTPAGIAVDSATNLYVADWGNHVIRKVTPAGVVTTFAGLAGNAGSADGAGSIARFWSPENVAVDAAGNVFVTDIGNHTIRKITPTGVVSTLAGLAGNPGSGDGIGDAARFNAPMGVAVDSGGTVYVTEYGNHTLRKITSAGVVTTLAGLAGYNHSFDGTGSAARFSAPWGVAVDNFTGNMYVGDLWNHAIRKVTTNGVVTTLAGRAATGLEDGNGDVARFNGPNGSVIDSAGNLYLADFGNHTVRKVSPEGNVTTLAGLANNPGNADGTGSAARFNGPASVARDGAGNLYVSEWWGQTIRKITLAGEVTTIAGLTGNTGSTDGTGTNALFNYPNDVKSDSAGNLYVADYWNHAIRKITTNGTVTTFAGLAGNAGYADGTGGNARLNGPAGLAVDADSNVYVVDQRNHVIRKITTNAVVSTVAGLAGNNGSVDGVGAAARFSWPHMLAVDPVGNLFVTDRDNHTLRKITAGGAVTTIGGLAGNWGNADGVATAARFHSPQGIAVDNAGNIYVAEGNQTIRKGVPMDGYHHDFEGTIGSEWSTNRTSVTPIGARKFLGQFGNQTVTLALTNLPIHAVTTVEFDLFVIRSWDGNSTTVGRDIWKLQVAGGPLLLQTTFGNGHPTSAADGQAYPGSYPGAVYPVRVGAAETNSLGYSFTDGAFSGPMDSVYHLKFTFAHSEANLVLNFIASGLQGTNDESWGLDNVHVRVDTNSLPPVADAYTFITLAGLAGTSGSANGAGSAARFNAVNGVAVDSIGNIFVGDELNHTIRKITPDGVVTTFAGATGISGSADSLTATNARFNLPRRLASDSSGNIYVADTGNNTIRKITASGVVTTLATGFSNPAGVAVDGAGNVFVCDANTFTIRKITPTGAVSIIAGSSGNSGTNDGTGDAARFSGANGVAVDNSGNIYVADSGNHTLRKIVPSGTNWVVSTLAGLAGNIGMADGTGNMARFYSPFGVAVDNAGNIFIGDRNNSLMRKVTPGGEVSTLGGLAGTTGSTDETGSAARFNRPTAIALDAAGNLYVADRFNNTVRKGLPPGAVQAPFIYDPPHSQTVSVGGNASFNVTAFGTGTLVYQWRKEGVELAGATDATLILTNVSVGMAGNYTVAISNNVGSVIAPAATLDVLAPNVAHYSDFEGTIGAEWSTNKTSVTPIGSRKFLGEFSNATIKLSLTNLPSHAMVTLSFDLFIIRTWDGNHFTVGPDIWSLSVSNGPALLKTTFCNHSLANQSFPGAYLMGNYPGYTGASEVRTLGYQDNIPSTQDAVYRLSYSFNHSGSNLAVNFAASGLEDISNESWGLDNVIVSVDTNTLPSVVSQPLSQTALVGTSSTFNVIAVGTEPLSYQWMFNQTNIPGASFPSYSVNQAQVADAGGYSVRITNPFGSAVSAPAFLSVIAPLTNNAGNILAPAGMINWWPGEGNARDIFANNDGTLQNGVFYASGKVGTAFRFDGASGYILTGIGNIPASWTVCVWVNRQNAPSLSATLLADASAGIKLEQSRGTRQVGITRYGIADYNFGYTAPTGTWVHLGFVGTATNTSLYVNGVLQSILGVAIALPRAEMGAHYFSSLGRYADFALASMDEIMLFNRALSVSEINAIYSAGSSGLLRTPEFSGSDLHFDGQLNLNLKGQTGKSFTLYSSTNLTDWLLESTFANPSGTIQIVDSITNSLQKFYRVSQP